MKKLRLLIGCEVLLCLLCLFSCNHSSQSRVNEAYFYQINLLIKDEDFDIAKVENYAIMLYNSENELQKEIIFSNYSANIKLISIRKEGSIIFFITDGSVDDEQGIFFINDNSNKLLDGMKTIKRIGGNSYQYSTSAW